MININLLPKNLRRRHEPGYWRIIAVLFPLVALAVMGFMQLAANQTVHNLNAEKADRELQLARLQPFIDEQQRLQARQRSLNQLITIANAVREDRIVWSDEFLAMLETLPAPSAGGTPNIAFKQLTMSSLDAGAQQQRTRDRTYEGAQPFAEMAVQGSAKSTEVLADYILALQQSSHFGVSFQSASLEESTGLYQFSLTVGALTGDHDEP